MLSLTHIIIIVVIILLIFGPSKLTNLGRGMGEGMRQFKKGMNGESDIDITHTVKQIKDDEENKT